MRRIIPKTTGHVRYASMLIALVSTLNVVAKENKPFYRKVCVKLQK